MTPFMEPQDRLSHMSWDERQLFVNHIASKANSHQFVAAQAGKAVQPHVRSVVAFFLISACGFLVSCSSPVASSSGLFPGQIKTGTTVCLLPPKVTYERDQGAGLTERDARTTTSINSFGLLNPDLEIGWKSHGERGATAEAISNDLTCVAGSAFQAHGVETIKSGELAERCPDKKIEIQELISDTENLLRGMKPAQTLARLRSFSDGTTNTALLVLRCTILVGSEGHVHYNAEKILLAGFRQEKKPTIHRAIFKAVVLRPEDGQVIWQNEVLLRDFPDVNHRNYQKAVALLFPKPTTQKVE